MDKATLLKTLTETRAAWETLLAQIDEEQMQRPGAAGKWSVKDVIAHVTWGESEIAPVLRTHVLAGSDLWNLSDDERNEITYQQNKDRPLHDIVNEEHQAYTALLEALQMLSDEDLNDPHRFKNMPTKMRRQLLPSTNKTNPYEKSQNVYAALRNSRPISSTSMDLSFYF